MISLNTKMDASLVNQVAVIEPQKLIHGGVGFSGIVAIVCASVMNKDQNLIVISIYVKPHQISLPTGKSSAQNVSQHCFSNLNSIFLQSCDRFPICEKESNHPYSSSRR